MSSPMLKIVLISALFLILISVYGAYADTSCVYMFYGEGCPHCQNAEEYISSIENNYDTNITRLNIVENAQLVNSLYEIYNVPADERGKVPILFVGEDYYLGDTSIIDNIDNALQECQNDSCQCPEYQESGNVSLLNIIGLAFVDAVNPCELAVLVILMTAILTRFPKQKKRALKAGLSFSLAIFLMYFLFGLLIISGFKFLTGVSDIGGSWFYTLLGIIAIVLGLLNIKDAIWYGGGGFIMEVPLGWRPRMKNLIAGTTSPKGAFIVGVIVSFFLTPCTAGPYFVAGGILSTLSILDALPYLLIYMAIFISPMLAITLIVYFGFMAVEDIGGWREKNIKILHWIAGLLLLGLGVLMLLGLI